MSSSIKEGIKLDLVPDISGFIIYKVREDFKVEWEDKVWTIPAGTPTNGITMPWWFRGIVPPLHPKYREAAVLHDYLSGEWTMEKLVDWKEATRIMDGLMKENGIGWLRRLIIRDVIMTYGRWSKNPWYG